MNKRAIRLQHFDYYYNIKMKRFGLTSSDLINENINKSLQEEVKTVNKNRQNYAAI